MMKIIILFFLFNLGFISASLGTPVKKCKDVTEDLFLNVTISSSNGVCTSWPCKFSTGTVAKADIEFPVKKEIKFIKMMAKVTVHGRDIHYDVPDADEGCNHLTHSHCPLQPDTDAEIEIKINIASYFPKVTADVQFYLLDQNKEMFSCFVFPAEIV